MLWGICLLGFIRESIQGQPWSSTLPTVSVIKQHDNHLDALTGRQIRKTMSDRDLFLIIQCLAKHCHLLRIGLKIVQRTIFNVKLLQLIKSGCLLVSLPRHTGFIPRFDSSSANARGSSERTIHHSESLLGLL